MPNAKVIVNPHAHAGKSAKQWPNIAQCLKSSGLSYDYEFTAYAGHAVELAKSAVSQEYRMVIAVGGDGTINEIVNGLYAAEGLNKVTMGIIGTGTGGDYIRTFGIPRDINDACQKLQNYRKLTVDLGVVEFAYNHEKRSRLFVNFAGIGFDAEIVRATKQTFKKMGSVPSYLMGLLSGLLLYKNKNITLTMDSSVEDLTICTILMSIGKYGGGAMLTAPNADPTDGEFDVVIVGDLSKPDLLKSLPMIYKGTHINHPKVRVHRARSIDIVTSKNAALQADGELLGEAPASFRIVPAALTLAV